jgi:hypothetical protein
MEVGSIERFGVNFPGPVHFGELSSGCQVAFSFDGKTLSTIGFWSGNVRLWDVSGPVPK